MVDHESFEMPGNIFVQRTNADTGDIEYSMFGRGYQRNAKELMANCRSRAQAAVERWRSGQSRLLPSPFGARVTSRLCYPVFYQLFCPTFNWFLHATSDCNRCGVCAQSCPTRNIRVSSRNVRFGTACTVCYRCINICPLKAIQLRWPARGLSNEAQYRFPGWVPPRHGGA